MLGTLFGLFILLPAAELFLLLKIGQLLGIYETLLIIVATGFAGAVLYRTQSWMNMRKMQQAVREGYIPDVELFDSVLIIVGALLLVTPGIITDTIGILTLLPFTRPLVRNGIKRWIKGKVQSGQIQVETY
jgi:UPF0716 protein FxsA